MSTPSVGVTGRMGRGERSPRAFASPPRPMEDHGSILLAKALECLEDSNRLRQLELDRQIQTLDLLIQERNTYQTKGTESDITIALEPQSVQQERIHSFSLGCTGPDAAIATLLGDTVIGYVQIGPSVIDFNVPSVVATQLDILIDSRDTRQFHLYNSTGDFPAGLTFFALLSGELIASQFGPKGVTH